jgi:hypothetical protein
MGRAKSLVRGFFVERFLNDADGVPRYRKEALQEEVAVAAGS